MFDKIKAHIEDNLMAGMYELELLNSLNVMKMEVLKNLLQEKDFRIPLNSISFNDSVL
jgi:hypothetical protein